MSTKSAIRADIRATLKAALEHVLTFYSGATSGSAKSLATFSSGKLFEVLALTKILEEVKALSPDAMLKPKLAAPGKFVIQGSPGKAHVDGDHVVLTNKATGKALARIWNSVEFIGLSASDDILSGNYHEADILIERYRDSKCATPNYSYRPHARDLLAVFECKYHQTISKAILRNQLGLRREMSLLCGPRKSGLHGLFDYPLTRSRFCKDLPATCADSGERVAPHVFLIYSYTHSKTNPHFIWQKPAKRYGLEFWSIW